MPAHDPSDLTRLPIFDPQSASCGTCELANPAQPPLYATAYRPEKFNGLMLIAEGPTRQGCIDHRPMVGTGATLLRATFASVGLDFDRTYMTNATLCKPPSVPKKSFITVYPNAVTSCLSRLEAEIAAVRPRVIVTLGSAAWLAVSGYDVEHTRHEPFVCGQCDEQRRVGPVIQCAASIPNPADGGKTAIPCHHLHFLNARASQQQQADEIALIKARGCESCSAKLQRVRPKMIKCPVCKGLKRTSVPYTSFTADYPLKKAGGAIFTPGHAHQTRAAHELHPWLRAHGVEYVVPVVHPTYILEGQSFAVKTLQKHMAKVGRLLSGRTPLAYTHENTSDPARVRAWFAGRTTVTVDIETIGRPDPEDLSVRLDARKIYNVESVTCIGFADGHDALVVDTQSVDPTNAEDALLGALFDVLTDDTIAKTYHHGAGYDVPVLDLVWGIPVALMLPSYTDDTLCAHAILYPDEPHDLGHVTFEFVDALAWKPSRVVKGSEVHGTYEELAAYNARDVVHTTLAREHMGVLRGKAVPGGRMDRAKLARVYELDTVLRREAVSMTMHGLPLEPVGWAAAGATAQGHIDDALSRIQEVVDEIGWGPFNPRSTRDKIAILYTSTKGFRLPVGKSTAPSAANPDGSPATDSSTLAKLLANTGNTRAIRFIAALREFLAHSYVATNYVFSNAMVPWADGRIHPVWKPWGAVTGRWTSSPNAQNWPKWLRALVRAPEGRKIVGADYDQLELRNMALLSGDRELMRRCSEADDQRKLEPDHDPHSYVASLAFGSRFTSLKLKDPTHDKTNAACKCETCARKATRDLTKRVIYGLNYGAGDAKVVESIYDGGYEGPPITIDMVRLVRRTVFQAFPGVEPWRANQVQVANATGELRGPLFGRRRIFPLADVTGGIQTSVPVTEIYNFPIQTMGGEIMNTQMALFLQRLPGVDPTAFTIAQVHDAIYVETSEDCAEAVAALLTETLTVEHTIAGATMRFTASGVVADSWKDAG